MLPVKVLPCIFLYVLPKTTDQFARYGLSTNMFL